MDRAGRTKKLIDYSEFENDDEDFMFTTAPPSKKPRTNDSQTKKEKREKLPKNQQKAAVTNRRTLDDKLYQRDLEVALALSVQETSIEVHSSPSIETCTDTKTDHVHCLPLLSNCSVDGEILELDTITDFKDHDLGTRCRRRAASKALSDKKKIQKDVSDDEDKVDDCMPDLTSELGKITDLKDNDLGTRCRRLTASKALSDQRKILIDVSDDEDKVNDCMPDLTSELDTITDFKDHDLGTRCRRQAASEAISDQRKILKGVIDDEDKVDDYMPDLASDSSSGSDSNFSEEEEAEFVNNKSKKLKRTKKKDTKQNMTTEKKSPKSRLNAAATSSATETITIKPQPALKTSVAPKPVESPLQTKSSLAGTQKPSWTPPSQSGNSSNPLGGVSVKSPNQSLRLGLSRFARVKPLHPSMAST
ncbi:RAD51-associated protein 1 [Lissotriton helveticus]